MIGRVSTWLPAGEWTDFFTGVRYSGGRTVALHRPLEGYPVLARAGGIVPLTWPGEYGTQNPAALEVHVFAGADGAYHYAVIHAGQDIRGLVKDMNAALHGRGGGRDGFAQGSVSCTEADIRAFFAGL